MGDGVAGQQAVHILDPHTRTAGYRQPSFTVIAGSNQLPARQIPKLPDWAVVDTTVPPDDRFPGKIAAAGFFGEKWEME